MANEANAIGGPLGIVECWRAGGHVLRKRGWVLWGAWFAVAVIGQVVTTLLTNELLALIGALILIPLQLGPYLLGLRLIRARDVAVWDLFEAYTRPMTVVGSTLWVGIIILAGWVLLIVPGFVWGLTYGFAPLLAVDRRLSARDALAASAAITIGDRWRLLRILAVPFGIPGILVALGTLLPVAVPDLLPPVWVTSVHNPLLIAGWVASFLLWPWGICVTAAAYERLTARKGPKPAGEGE